MIARPTATSAAAMTKMKTTKTLPRSSMDADRRENATSARFVAFSMSSTHIRITTALRRTRTPAVPMKNSTADTATNQPSGTVGSISLVLVPLHEYDRADHRRQEQHRRDLERKAKVPEDARGERLEVVSLRRHCHVAKRQRVERDEDPDRRDDERGPRRLALEEERVRPRLLRSEHHAVQDQDGDRADVDQHLERGDRLRAEQHEHPGDVQERERHEQRRGRDAVGQHDADAGREDAGGEQPEERRLEEVEAHLLNLGLRPETRRRRAVSLLAAKPLVARTSFRSGGRGPQALAQRREAPLLEVRDG